MRERNSSRYRRFGNAIGGRIWRRRPRGGSYWREPRYPSPPAGPTYSNAIGRVAMPTLWPWQWDTGCLVGCGDSTACPSLQVALAYSPGRSVHVTTRSISPQYPRSPMLSFATKKLSIFVHLRQTEDPASLKFSLLSRGFESHCLPV